MPILKIASKRGLYKLVGASLPSWVHSYIASYGMAKGITKTEILKPLLVNWITKQRKDLPDEVLVQEIIERLKSQWKFESLIPGMTLLIFKNNMEKELIKRGIFPDYIKQIVKEIDSWNDVKQNHSVNK